MLNFVRKAFRKFFEFWLWLNLIVCTVGGGVGFYFTVAQESYSSWSGYSEVNGGLVFLGVIIGLVVGLMSNLLIGGLVSIFLKMDENLEQLKNKVGSSV